MSAFTRYIRYSGFDSKDNVSLYAGGNRICVDPAVSIFSRNCAGRVGRVNAIIRLTLTFVIEDDNVY